MDEYRPRIVSPELAAERGAALTPVPPQTAVSYVEQNERRVPPPPAQGINVAQQQAQQQAQEQGTQQQMPQPQHQPPQYTQTSQQPMPPQYAQTSQQQMRVVQLPSVPAEIQRMPPPHYPVHGAEMQQQYYNPAIQPQLAIPAERVKVSNQNTSYKMQCKASSICTGWKGILEIAARVAVVVVAVICLGLSSVILNTIESNTYFDIVLSIDRFSGGDIIVELQDLIILTRALVGYMIFVAIFVFLVEIPTILARFTVRAGIGMLRIFHVLDAIAVVILAIFFLSGMAPAASYSAKWAEPPPLCEDAFENSLGTGLSCDEQELTAELASLSIVAFVGMVLTIFLTVWTIKAAITGWDHVDDDV